MNGFRTVTMHDFKERVTKIPSSTRDLFVKHGSRNSQADIASNLKKQRTGTSSELEITAVEDFKQLCQAFHLVHELFVASGYIKEQPRRLQFSLFQLLPTSKTFVALSEGVVVGTVSIVLDSPADIPAGSMFSKEIDMLRREGRTVAEGTMFACQSGSQEKPSLVTIKLLKSVFRWCSMLGLDDLCIVVNPKHRLFWERLVGFEYLAAVKSCSHIKGPDGVFMRFDLRGAIEGSKRLHGIAEKLFAGAWQDHSASYKNYQLGDEEITVLLLEQPSLLDGANQKQREILMRHYPMVLSIIAMHQTLRGFESDASGGASLGSSRLD